jgi:hypothetical protein
MASKQAPFVHSVHFYETDEALIQRIGSIVLSGIDAGVSALLVMTEEHKFHFQQFLKRRGIDLHAAERDGQLCILDAEATLAQFMVDGRPDEERFQTSVGELVCGAKAYSQRAGLTVFGEMVAVLWQHGNQQGAIELEALWNNLLNERTFHLHCAYPKALFKSRRARTHISVICDHHSITVGAIA